MRYARSKVWLTCVGLAFLLVFTASPGVRATASNVPLAAVTDAPAQDIPRAYLEVQAELQATQLALERNRQEAETAATRNAELLETRPRLLEQALVGERARAFDSVERSQQLLLIFAGVGLLAILLTAYLHWRAPSHLSTLPVAYARGQGHAVASAGPSGTSLMPVGQTEQSTARLLGAIGRLEQRVHELEHTAQTHRPEAEETAAEAQPGTSAQPELAGAESLSAILLSKGQSLLNLDEQENAVACFNEILKLDPNHAEALVKKGVALEQLDRLEEAIACYDRALDANRSMTVAYLRKGGLCNRMARYSEALECYEQALRTQEGSHTA
jgi:tetratricopeptide (TPR) repeat protein